MKPRSADLGHQITAHLYSIRPEREINFEVVLNKRRRMQCTIVCHWAQTVRQIEVSADSYVSL